MVESFNSAVFDESSGIGDDTTGCTTDVLVDLKDFFNGLRDNEGRLESPLDSKHDAFGALDADSG